MWQIYIFATAFSAVAFGAPQFIASPFTYYTPQQQFQPIRPSNQYILLYPQYPLLARREGGEAEGSFSSANTFKCFPRGGSDSFRAIIPPNIDTKLPIREQDQKEPVDKDQVDRQPSNPSAPAKPFYYVLPPSPDFNYYFPQPDLFAQPNFLPKYVVNSAVKFPKAISLNRKVDPRSDESDMETPSITTNGHVNEKNVN